MGVKGILQVMEYPVKNPKSIPSALKGACALIRSVTDTCKYMLQGDVNPLKTRKPKTGTFANREDRDLHCSLRQNQSSE